MPSHLLLVHLVTNDAFRTLATDQDFKDKVSEEALVRLLDAFAWSHLGELDFLPSLPLSRALTSSFFPPDTFTYVQGPSLSPSFPSSRHSD